MSCAVGKTGVGNLLSRMPERSLCLILCLQVEPGPQACESRAPPTAPELQPSPRETCSDPRGSPGSVLLWEKV